MGTGRSRFKVQRFKVRFPDGLAEQPAFKGSTVQKFNDGFGRDEDGMAPFKVQCSKVQLTLAMRNLGFTCPSSSSRSKLVLNQIEEIEGASCSKAPRQPLRSLPFSGSKFRRLIGLGGRRFGSIVWLTVIRGRLQ